MVSIGVSIGALLFGVQGNIAEGQANISTLQTGMEKVQTHIGTLQTGMEEVQDTLRTHVNAQTEAAALQDDPNEIATIRSPAVPLDGGMWLGLRAGGPADRNTVWDGGYTTEQADRGAAVDGNGFPAGFRYLTAASMYIEAVQVVGCLTRADDGVWELIRATHAVLADDPSASSAEALAALAGRPLGTRTFELMVSSDPAVHDGHVMEVKGYLFRSPDGDRIAVSTLGMVASTCDP